MEKEAGAEGATLGQAAEEVQRFRLDQPVRAYIINTWFVAVAVAVVRHLPPLVTGPLY